MGGYSNKKEEERVRRLLLDFFSKHAPNDLGKVESIVAKGIPEERLLKELHEQYGVTPPSKTSSPKPNNNNQAPTQQRLLRPAPKCKDLSDVDKANLKKRTVRFYEKYSPKDVNKADAPLSMNITEEEVVEILCKKYPVSREEVRGMMPMAELGSWDKLRVQRIVEEIYAVFSPEDVEKAANTATMKATETEVYGILMKKYNISPEELNRFRSRYANLHKDTNAATVVDTPTNAAAASASASGLQTSDAMGAPTMMMGGGGGGTLEPQPSLSAVQSPSMVASQVLDPAKKVNEYGPEERERLRRRLVRFYKQFNPQEVGKVETALDMKFTEEKVMNVLCKKYTLTAEQLKRFELEEDAKETASSSDATSHLRSPNTSTAMPPPADRATQPPPTPDNSPPIATAATLSSPHLESSSPTTGGGVPMKDLPSTDKARVKRRLERFYRQYSPEDVNKAGNALEMPISEMEVYRVLAKRYQITVADILAVSDVVEEQEEKNQRQQQQAAPSTAPLPQPPMSPSPQSGGEASQPTTTTDNNNNLPLLVKDYSEAEKRRLVQTLTLFYETYAPQEVQKAQNCTTMNVVEEKLYEILLKKYPSATPQSIASLRAEGAKRAAAANEAAEATSAPSGPAPMVPINHAASTPASTAANSRSDVTANAEVRATSAAVAPEDGTLQRQETISVQPPLNQPQQPGAPPRVCELPEVERSRVRENLVRFYKAYKPEELHKADNVGTMTMTEERVYEVLMKKYGVRTEDMASIIVRSSSSSAASTAPIVRESNSVAPSAANHTAPSSSSLLPSSSLPTTVTTQGNQPTQKEDKFVPSPSFVPPPAPSTPSPPHAAANITESQQQQGKSEPPPLPPPTSPAAPSSSSSTFKSVKDLPNNERDILRIKLTRFYDQYNPQETATKVDLALNMTCTEEELWGKLFKRYNLDANGVPMDPSPSATTTSTTTTAVVAAPATSGGDDVNNRNNTNNAVITAPPPASDDMTPQQQLPPPPQQPKRENEEQLRRRLVAFCEKHNPHEMHKVDLALRTDMSEEELFRKLYAKYNLDAYGQPIQTFAVLTPKLQDDERETHQQQKNSHSPSSEGQQQPTASASAAVGGTHPPPVAPRRKFNPSSWGDPFDDEADPHNEKMKRNTTTEDPPLNRTTSGMPVSPAPSTVVSCVVELPRADSRLITNAARGITRAFHNALSSDFVAYCASAGASAASIDEPRFTDYSPIRDFNRLTAQVTFQGLGTARRFAQRINSSVHSVSVSFAVPEARKYYFSMGGKPADLQTAFVVRAEVQGEETTGRAGIDTDPDGNPRPALPVNSSYVHTMLKQPFLQEEELNGEGSTFYQQQQHSPMRTNTTHDDHETPSTSRIALASSPIEPLEAASAPRPTAAAAHKEHQHRTGGVMAPSNNKTNTAPSTSSANHRNATQQQQPEVTSGSTSAVDHYLQMQRERDAQTMLKQRTQLELREKDLGEREKRVNQKWRELAMKESLIQEQSDRRSLANMSVSATLDKPRASSPQGHRNNDTINNSFHSEREAELNARERELEIGEGNLQQAIREVNRHKDMLRSLDERLKQKERHLEEREAARSSYEANRAALDDDGSMSPSPVRPSTKATGQRQATSTDAAFQHETEQYIQSLEKQVRVLKDEVTILKKEGGKPSASSSSPLRGTLELQLDQLTLREQQLVQRDSLLRQQEMAHAEREAEFIQKSQAEERRLQAKEAALKQRERDIESLRSYLENVKRFEAGMPNATVTKRGAHHQQQAENPTTTRWIEDEEEGAARNTSHNDDVVDGVSPIRQRTDMSSPPRSATAAADRAASPTSSLILDHSSSVNHNRSTTTALGVPNVPAHQREQWDAARRRGPTTTTEEGNRTAGTFPASMLGPASAQRQHRQDEAESSFIGGVGSARRLRTTRDDEVAAMMRRVKQREAMLRNMYDQQQRQRRGGFDSFLDN